MIHLTASLVAIAFYLIAALYQGLYLAGRARAPRRSRFLLISAVAIAAHSASAFATIYTEQGIDLGFFRVSSLIFWFISLIGWFMNLRRPLENALVLLFPLAALAILVSSVVQGPDTYLRNLNAGVLSHILLSILAYSVFTLCALQALVLAFQERELKQRQVKGALNVLPPLQTMESMLFEMLWIGIVLLSLAIATGAIFIEDLFAQHLVHKTVFSLLAWLIFAGLLWGHHQLGWRGHTAVRWTLGGFFTLMLAYFGTKLVLELILQQPS